MTGVSAVTHLPLYKLCTYRTVIQGDRKIGSILAISGCITYARACTLTFVTTFLLTFHEKPQGYSEFF